MPFGALHAPEILLARQHHEGVQPVLGAALGENAGGAFGGVGALGHAGLLLVKPARPALASASCRPDARRRAGGGRLAPPHLCFGPEAGAAPSDRTAGISAVSVVMAAETRRLH